MTTPNGNRPRWWLLAAALVVLAGLTVLAVRWIAPIMTRARIESWVDAAGPWGPLVLLGIQVGQILAAPIPGLLVPILAGVFYGPVVGPLLAMVGTVIGSTLAYWIGRTAGHAVAERLLGKPALDKAHELLRGKRWIGLALVFIVPFTPADALCFVAGIAGMGSGPFALAVLVGRVPKEAILAAGAALGWNHLGF